MHLPIDDVEHQLQLLCDPRQTSTEWRVVKQMNQDAPEFLGSAFSAVLFLLIAEHVAELTWPFDEMALPVRPFLIG
jgi:hypothetical protein